MSAEDVRTMSGRERMSWDSALRIARTWNRDDADDELARRANNLECASITAELSGRHDDAADMWRASELLDVARKALT